jgi:hypothetical protein
MDDTMMWLVATVILVAIGGLFIMILVLGGGEGMAQYLEQWCMDNPRICGVTDESSLNYQIAQNSAEALACAINSVTLGQKKTDGCEEYLKKVTGSGGIIDSPFKTVGGVLMGSDYRNLMEELDYSDSSTPRIYPGPAGFQYNDFITGMATGEELGLEIPQVDCGGSGDGFNCTVSGFNIPENYNNWFGDAKQVVGGFGDPNMLVYYTKFPQGENDDWQGFTPWFRTLSGVVLLSACAGRAVGFVASAGSKLVRGTESLITRAKERFSKMSKLLPVSAGNKLDDITRQIAKTKNAGINILRPVRNIDEATHVMLADDVVENAMRRSKNVDEAFERYLDDVDLSKATATEGELEDAFKGIEKANREAIELTAENADTVIRQSRMLTENIGETSFKRTLTNVYGLDEKQVAEIVANANLLLSNPSAKRRVFGQAAAGLGAWFASYLDSTVGKFVNEFPSSLVLHVAMRPDLRRTFPLDIPTVEPDLSEIRSVDFSYGMPVMLDRSALQGNMVHFYSASPCMANIEVTKDTVPCDNFVYDSSTDLTMCENNVGVLEALRDALEKNHDCNTVKNVIPESESRLDEVAANLSSNMNSVTVYVKGVDTDKIYYPLLRPGVGHEDGYLYFIFDRTTMDVTHVYANIGNAPDDDSATMEKDEYPIDNIRVASGKGYRLGAWKGVECAVNVWSDQPERRLLIGEDDGCSVFKATDDKEMDMGILEGDEVIRCVFDGKDGEGFIFQDYCVPCGEVETSMTFYYNLTSSGSPGDFLGMKIEQFRSKIANLKGGRLILIDSDDIDSERDGRIDVVSFAEGSLKRGDMESVEHKIGNLVFDDGWSATFVDAGENGFDGKPDSVHNRNCNTPAIMLKVDKEGEDSEGNNYCIKNRYRSTLEMAVAIGGGVASIATAFMKASVLASIAGIIIDCGLGLAEAKLAGHNWPDGGGGIFKPTFV